MTEPYIISKSKYLMGEQCPKRIYLHFHKPKLAKSNNLERQVALDRGNNVGHVGRTLFNGGFDVSQNNAIKGDELTKATAKALKSNEHIFYEPQFESEDGHYRFKADIFVLSRKRKAKIIEVKSSTFIKTPTHILDIAFQWLVFKSSVYSKVPIDFYIAYLNRDYKRQGSLNLDELFHLEKVTSRAEKAGTYFVERHLKKFQKILSVGNSPHVEPGNHCYKPYECEFISHCWKKKSKSSIHNIGGLSQSKISKLVSEGISDAEKIPRNEKLSSEQWIQIDALIKRRPSINVKAINKFLKSIEPDKPIMFIDFEYMMPPVPMFNETSPYDKICFQYCVIYRKSPDSELQTREFIAEPGYDPRKTFIEHFLHDTVEDGNIIVYSETAEKTRLTELAHLFPQYAKQIQNRIDRIKDLMQPFKDRCYYNSDMKGSYSLKSVLKNLCNDLTYEQLPINNGMVAMATYESLHTQSYEMQLKVKNDLRNYCYNDVLSMIKIIKALQELVET